MTREEAISLLTQVNHILVNSNSWLENTHEPLNMAFDMAIKALEQEPRKGHWTEEFNDLEGEVRFTCSSCGKYQLFGTDFCYHCGSDNREVVEE